MINQDVASSGLEACSTVTSMPILQDNEAGQMWLTLGAIYNSYLVFDGAGNLLTSYTGKTLPGVAEELTQAVNQALGNQ